MIYTIVRKDVDAKIDAVISFDSVTSMEESQNATVTSQTVEYGFNISDNINIESPTYSISAIISSYSLFDLDKEIVWDGETFKSEVEYDSYPHIRAREEIVRVFSDRSLVTLIESTANSNNPFYKEAYEEIKSDYYKEIDNCVITSLSISHPDSGTGAFYISMNLQKIVMANIETAELTGDEQRAGIKPLMKVSSNTTSSSKTKTENIDPETGLPVEEEVIEEEVVGNYDAELERMKEESGYNKYEAKLKAKARARYMVELTGDMYSWVPSGSGFVVIKGTDPSVLLTKEGWGKYYGY